jgi:hypothetical protein
MPLRCSETLPPVMVSSDGITIATRSYSDQSKNRTRIFARCCEGAAPLAVTSTLSSIGRRPILQPNLSLEPLLFPTLQKLSPGNPYTQRGAMADSICGSMSRTELSKAPLNRQYMTRRRFPLTYRTNPCSPDCGNISWKVHLAFSQIRAEDIIATILPRDVDITQGQGPTSTSLVEIGSAPSFKLLQQAPRERQNKRNRNPKVSLTQLVGMRLSCFSPWRVSAQPTCHTLHYI